MGWSAYDFTADRIERGMWYIRRKLRTLKDMYTTDVARLIVSSFIVASMLILTIANIVDKVMWLKIVFFN